MDENTAPDTFHIDLTSANGTPFRFVFLPENGAVRYYDRRFAVEPGKQVHRDFTEDGQACGPAMAPSVYLGGRSGFRGWHEVDVWDVDRDTAAIVGVWLHHLIARMEVTE